MGAGRGEGCEQGEGQGGGSGVGGSGGSAGGGAGDEGSRDGGSAPDDKGKGFLSWYCNKLREPRMGVCLPGFACVGKAVRNLRVLWGVREERVREFVGVCVLEAGKGVVGG